MITDGIDRKGQVVTQDPSMGDTPADSGGSIPGGGGGSPSTSYASLGARIGARLLDVLLIGIPASIILAIVGLGSVGTGVVVSLLWFGYFVWFESNQGATVGKKILNMRVVGPDGSYPAVDVAAKRNVWMLAGIIPVVGGLLSLIAVIVIIVTISQSEENRGYHDTFAGTAVLR